MNRPQSSRFRRWAGFVLLGLLVPLCTLLAAPQADYYMHLPLVTKPIVSCAVPGESYAALPVAGPPTDIPAASHPDMNLGVLGYELTTAALSLVTLGPVHDVKAPQLPALFADYRTPTFSNAYQRYRWDWGCGCPKDTYSPWDTTVLGMATTPGEVIHAPDTGYSIGGSYRFQVLYAAPNRLTLHVGTADRVDGYVIHLEDVCVEPDLLALYEALNAAGRGQLPALRGHQPLGRAMGGEIKVAMRDSGHFLDPRSRNDWWQGR